MTIPVFDRADDDKLISMFAVYDKADPLPVPGDVLHLFDMTGRPVRVVVEARVLAQTTINGRMSVTGLVGRVL